MRLGTQAADPASRKPRVMVFTDSFIHGGTERQLVQALKVLDQNKYDLVVGCLRRRGPFLPVVQTMGLQIIEFPITSLYGPSTLRWMAKLVRFCRSERISVVHAFDFYTNCFAVTAGRLAGVPVVIASRRELAVDRTLAQRWAIRVACEMADAVVANSLAAGSSLTGLFAEHPEKVFIVPNGLDLTVFHAWRSGGEARRELGIDPATPLVGTLAALRPEKDLATFLRAAARVRSSLPGARFVVIGDGPDRDNLQSFARELGINDATLFLGDHRDVPDLLSAFDVFVLSSTTESSPNAVLEAMAVAVPVVATRVGGTPELVEDGVTGYLVPASDAEAMARRIVDLLRDPERRRAMGESGRSRVEREFTSARMKQKLETLYDGLLRLKKPAARVLQIGNYPPPVCGWSIHTQLVERELALRGADSRVMDIGPSRRIENRSCETVRNGFDYAWKLVRWRWKGFTFHVHGNGDSWKGYTLAVAAVLVGRITGKPAVLTFHAGPKQIYFPRQSGFWYRTFWLLFSASGEIICNHEAVKQVIASYGVPAEKIHTIPAFSVQYTEELSVPLPEAVEEFQREHEPRLFSYSLFRPEFTMEALFEAFAAVRRVFPHAGLLIAGPQEVPAEAAEKMQRLGIAEAVFIPGNLPHAEFLTTVRQSDVFVRTHLRDGVCSSVLEALWLGVPVIASDDGLRPPSVVTYTPGDAADLERKLTAVLRDLSGARAKVRPPSVPNHLEKEIALLLAAGAQGAMKLRKRRGRTSEPRRREASEACSDKAM